MVLNLGPFLTIQIHSYQACEVKDRLHPEYNHENMGGLDHFEIYVFRNSEIIGGKPCEIIQGKSFFAEKNLKESGFLGYNEEARDLCFQDFLRNLADKSLLQDHRLTIEIATAIYLSISKKRSGGIPFIRKNLDNFYTISRDHSFMNNFQQQGVLSYAST
ncbi:MAG: hypothetical protein JSR76_04520 [Verrucomicrobia bacterium]|nr:hypothetical protein [Verrucomicrobiota bacterium]